jgi:ubiquitin-protein ligase
MNPALITKSNHRILQEIKKGYESKTYQLIIPTIEGVENPNIVNVAFQTHQGFYKGQTHVLEVKFQWGNPISNYYPFHPPLMTFKTPIWHPNISGFPGGAICLDFLKQNGMWSATCSLEGLIEMIKAMLDDPNPDSPQNPEAGKSYKDSIKNNTWQTICSKYYDKHISSCQDILDKFEPFPDLEAVPEIPEKEPDSEDSEESSEEQVKKVSKSRSTSSSTQKTSTTPKSSKSSKLSKTIKKSSKSSSKSSKKDR